jgi:hypothetical protein
VIETIEISEWAGPFEDPLRDRAVASLEGGAVLAFPQLPFALDPTETEIVRSAASDVSSKNISLDPATGECRGTALEGVARERLAALMERFAQSATRLVLGLAPGYQSGLIRGRTSLRPTEIAGRQTSWRKDDKRLHVDAFPTRPTHGRRILRVFANIDLEGTPRRWRVGPDFEAYATRFLPKRPSVPVPGKAALLHLLRVTRSRRSRYDEIMLQLHDAAKADMAWQDSVAAEEVLFPAGTSWAVFTDQVPHAALAGRNALEQTFLIEPTVLAAPDHAPVAVLERLRGRAAAGRPRSPGGESPSRRWRDPRNSPTGSGRGSPSSTGCWAAGWCPLRRS